MRCEILIGMIASGKSTYCQTRAKEGALIINDDAIVNAIHANCYHCYNKTLKPLYKSIELSIFHYAAVLDQDVVVDRPNYKKETRQRYIGIAQSLDFQEVLAIVMPLTTDEEHARRRFYSDNRGRSFEYWLEVVREHRKLYGEPSLEEGFTGIQYL